MSSIRPRNWRRPIRVSPKDRRKIQEYARQCNLEREREIQEAKRENADE